MEKNSPPAYFGEWLQQRRKALDLTRGELAQQSGCSVFALRKIESGERRPSKQLAGLLAAALGIPTEDINTFIRAARGELNLERLTSPRQAPSTAGQPAPGPSNVHLPLRTTAFIGRQPELDALGKIFGRPECRLLTLTVTTLYIVRQCDTS